MPSQETNSEAKNSVPSGISFRFLGSLILAFLLGCASYALFQNLASQQPVSFSTTSLIGFILSVLLSGASIVLAVSAIMLGKFSEQVMIKRSDESIRLQNEVFQKTTDALQRIESSTGVTEKRIEDIISGRVGDLSEKIANFASGEQDSKGQLKSEDVEKMIKVALLHDISGLDISRRSRNSTEELEKRAEAERKEQEERRKRKAIYQSRHTEILQAFSSRNDLTALKMHHGSASNYGDELFDGIYKRNDGQRIAVTTFSREVPLTEISHMDVPVTSTG